VLCPRQAVLVILSMGEQRPLGTLLAFADAAVAADARRHRHGARWSHGRDDQRPQSRGLRALPPALCP